MITSDHACQTTVCLQFLAILSPDLCLLSYREWWLLIFPELRFLSGITCYSFAFDYLPVLPIVSNSFPDCLHVSASRHMFPFPLLVSGLWCFVKVCSKTGVFGVSAFRIASLFHDQFLNFILCLFLNSCKDFWSFLGSFLSYCYDLRDHFTSFHSGLQFGTFIRSFSEESDLSVWFAPSRAAFDPSWLLSLSKLTLSNLSWSRLSDIR